MLGKPVAEGTRITVEQTLDELSHGQSFEALLKSHPTPSREGVEAALEYVAKVLSLDVVDAVEVG